MALSNRDRTLIVGLGAGLFGFAGWFFWLSPTAAAIDHQQQRIQELDQTLTMLTKRQALLAATSHEITSNPDAVKLLTLGAPATSDIQNLLASLDAMATTGGLRLASVQPSNSADHPTEVTLTVSVTGTFSAVRAFVGAVEQNVRPLVIQALSLASGASGSGSTLVTATINLGATTASAPVAQRVSGGGGAGAKR